MTKLAPTTDTILACCVSPHPNHQANFINLLEHLDALSSLNTTEAATVNNPRKAPSYQRSRSVLAKERQTHIKSGWPVRHVTITASTPFHSNLRIAHPVFREFTPEQRRHWQHYLDTWSDLLMFYVDLSDMNLVWDGRTSTWTSTPSPSVCGYPPCRVGPVQRSVITRILDPTRAHLRRKRLRVLIVVRVAEKMCDEHGLWLTFEQEQVLRDLRVLPVEAEKTMVVVDGSDGDAEALVGVLRELSRDRKGRKYREDGARLVKVGRRGRLKLRLRRFYRRKCS